MNKKRLLKLADFLETVPKKRFFFGHWVGDDWMGKADLSCGTTACAVGWACAIPSFRRAGLKLVKTVVYSRARPVFEGEEYFFGVSRFFDITDVEAQILFQPKEEYHKDNHGVLPKQSTPKQVARHIRKFVAKKEKEDGK